MKKQLDLLLQVLPAFLLHLRLVLLSSASSSWLVGSWFCYSLKEADWLQIQSKFKTT